MRAPTEIRRRRAAAGVQVGGGHMARRVSGGSRRGRAAGNPEPRERVRVRMRERVQVRVGNPGWRERVWVRVGMRVRVRRSNGDSAARQMSNEAWRMVSGEW